MAPSSSSTKKAARLAQKGKGQKIRFQGGTLFPLIVAVVVVLGSLLVVYARQSRPAADASAPTIDDHWHHTYGFYICGEWVQLNGAGEDTDASGRPLNTEYARTGVHSHDDGLIHWHAFSSAAVGRRATLGLFLGVYDVELSKDVLQLPADQRAQLPEAFRADGRFESGETECPATDTTDAKVGKLRVVRWDNTTDQGDGTTFIAGFDDVALNKDAMVVTIAFVPDGTDVGKPPWITDFDQNVSNDSGQLPATDLFPGVDVSPNGDVTVGSEPLNSDDVGPAVTVSPDATVPESTVDATSPSSTPSSAATTDN